MNTTIKAYSLLTLRLSTGIYLILWGIVKFNAERAARVSDKYYSGVISDQTISLMLGSLQILLGFLVILGLFRVAAYWGQLVWYAAGIVPIFSYIIDPLALYLVEAPGRLTFFPSTTLLFASLVLIAFKEYDTISLDHKRGR